MHGNCERFRKFVTDHRVGDGPRSQEVKSYRLPPHRSSAAVLVPSDLGEGGVDRDRQGTDDHPVPHLSFAIVFSRFQNTPGPSIPLIRRQTMHQ